MQHLSMPDSNFSVCAQPCLAYTASITLNHQELA